MSLTEQDKIKEQLASGQIPTRQINADIPTEEIELPSQGRYYPEGHPLSTGKIILRYPTAKDEDTLTSRNLIQKGTVVDVFLKSLVVDKTINLDDMLLGDKNALVIASRIMAYGKEYPVEVKCPSCGAMNTINIDISELQPKEIEGFEKISGNEFEIALPASKANIRFKILSQHDDKEVDSILKQTKKSISMQTSPEITTRLRVAILSINGNEDRMEIKRFVDSMLTLDSKALRDEIGRLSPDIEMNFPFQCEECGYEERMNMPLGINFFWPGRK
jgi:predicted RNA-binding Zn-ribbon protein involved in translation (DUF1610 family)